MDIVNRMEEVNHILYPIFNDDMFEIRNDMIEKFGFSNKVKGLVYNKREGCLHSGKLVDALTRKFVSLGTPFFCFFNILLF